MARYAPAPVPTTDLGQTQRFLREEYEQVRNSTDDIYAVLEFAIEQFVVSGYGQLERANAVSLGTLNDTWQTVTFETSSFDPKSVVYGLPDQMKVVATGIWRADVFINLSFSDSNAGREIQLRLFNATDGVGGNPVDFYVGRNQNGVTLAINLMFPVDLAEGDPPDGIALQVRSAFDSFSTTAIENAVWGLNHVSEYIGSFANDLNSIDRR